MRRKNQNQYSNSKIPKLFISHSMDRSTRFSTEICKFIQDIFQIKKWISTDPENLGSGPYDHSRIVDNAIDSDFCLSIITPENYKRPWILFEAGIFYGLKKPVFFIMCGGINHKDLKYMNYPIEGYGSYLDRESMKTLVITINSYVKDDIESVNRRFERFFDELYEKYKIIFPINESSLIEEDEDLQRNMLRIFQA